MGRDIVRGRELHRPKFIQIKIAFTLSDPLLLKNNRSRIIPLYHKSYYPHRDRKQYNTEQRQHYIEKKLKNVCANLSLSVIQIERIAISTPLSFQL